MFVNGNEYIEVSIGWNKGIDGLGYIYLNRNVFYDKVIEFNYDDNTISIYTNVIAVKYVNDIRILLTYIYIY